jgi:GrpB-like predicted nucleotidyltransferase (UPF0157 family)
MLSSNNTNSERITNDAFDIPDYILGRINLCVETFNIIMSSKPDKLETSVVIVCDDDYAKQIKERLLSSGVSEQYIEYDSTSKSVESTFNNLLSRIKKLTNPPCIYFISSVWHKDLFNSVVTSKLKDYKVFFEGALDNRPYELVQRDKLSEKPKKGTAYYKGKMTNKAVDILLNYIFPKNKNKTNNTS